MTSLQRAMIAAHDRKMAGVNDPDAQGVVLAESEFQDRAIFSGLDVEYGELVGTSGAVADVYMQSAQTIGLRALFISSWCDGLLTGLLLASLPQEGE